MKDNNYIFVFIALLVVFILQSCQEPVYVPKPRGYPKVDYPEKKLLDDLYKNSIDSLRTIALLLLNIRFMQQLNRTHFFLMNARSMLAGLIFTSISLQLKYIVAIYQ